MRSTMFATAILAAACCTPAPGQSAAVDREPASPPPILSEPATPAEIARGRQLVEMACISCHEVEPGAISPHPDAPNLTNLSKEYPVSLLDEAFAEGIMVGHPDMPEFKLLPQDVRALIGYLESIQAERAI